MEAIYLLFALVTAFGVGAGVGFACRGLIAKEIERASAEFKSAVADVRDVAKEIKTKV